MSTLTDLRNEIDLLDAQLVAVLGQRVEVCRTIARIKREQQISMMQPGRVAEVKRRCAQLGQLHGLDPDFITQLYQRIIDETCRIEDEIITRRPEKEPA